MDLNEVLIRPIITEKSTSQKEVGVYAFQISASANKILVKQAVEKFFSIKVKKVRVVLQKPKSKVNARTRRASKRPLLRKAYVFIKDKGKIPELDM